MIEHKKQKSEVDYSPGHADSHCGPLKASDRHYCEHFQVGYQGKVYKQGGCTKVAGPINPAFWCELYEKAKR